MKRCLINLSNHPSTKWEESQKNGWDEIYDIPFPSINPYDDIPEIYNLAVTYFYNVKSFIQSNSINKTMNYYCMLQGEFTFCYILYPMLREILSGIVIPTTERIVVEEGDKKISTFKFVRWRFL